MLVIITNASKQQTRKDLLTACCSPRGTQVVFDFRKCWIDDELLNSLGDQEQRAGQRCLLLYYDPRVPMPMAQGAVDASIPDASLPLGPVNDEFTFVPIRYGTVVEYVQQAASVTFVIQLDDWYRYKLKHVENDRGIRDKQASLHAAMPLRPRPGRRLDSLAVGLDKTTFVMSVEDRDFQFRIDEGEAAHCITSLSYIRTLPGLQDCTFWFCADTECFRSHSAQAAVEPVAFMATRPSTACSIGAGEIRRISVSSGHRELVTLFVLHGLESNGKIPTIKIDQDVASVSGPFTAQSNGGIVVSYELLFTPQMMTREVFVTLDTPALDDRSRAGSVLALSSRPGWEVAGPAIAAQVSIRAAEGTIWAVATLSLLALVSGSADLGILSKLIDGASAASAGRTAVLVYVATKVFAVTCGLTAWAVAIRRGVRRLVSSDG